MIHTTLLYSIHVLHEKLEKLKLHYYSYLIKTQNLKVILEMIHIQNHYILK